MYKLFIKTNKIKAEGFFKDGSLIILKGSQAAKAITSSFPQSQLQEREYMVLRGILIEADTAFIFCEDYVCSSPSRASNLITGSSSNGMILWKDEHGNTLKSLQKRID